MSALLSESSPVLIVDDDAALAGTLADILALNGFAARTAGTGRRALALAREFSPSVAVVDLRLPDMNGLDLASELHAGARHMQVIILTGNASVDTAIRALRDEDCDYLVKPVEPAALVRTLRAADDRHRLRGAEESLRGMQELLRAVFDASPLPVMTVDVNGRVTLWNHAAERVFGWRADEVLGGLPPMTSAEQLAEAGPRMAAVLRGETFVGLDVQRRRRNGEIADLRQTLAPVPDGNGNVIGVLSVYEDITERRRIDEHLREAQRLDQIGRLAGGVAHDFNNLLSVIMAESDLALTDSALTTEVRGTLQSVHSAAEAGAALTKQLLAFARRQDFTPEIVDTNALVSGLDRMLRLVAGSRVQLVLDCAEEVGSVRADRGQLEQILTNLVANARDAMPQGGTVTIATRNGPPPGSGRLPTLDAAECVVLSVSDTGTGIPLAVRQRMFEPFFTTKERGKGTGLGLATCHGIVQRFGGVITVDSVIGAGSTFRVFLPRADGVQASSVPASARPSAVGSESVLVVEDQPSLRAIAGRVLEQLGHTVYLAATGAEALALMGGLDRAPDLVLIDVNLPDGDGPDFVRRMREREPLLKVLLTSGAIETMVERGVDARFLPKPYDIDTLARAVRAALEGTAEL